MEKAETGDLSKLDLLFFSHNSVGDDKSIKNANFATSKELGNSIPVFSWFLYPFPNPNIAKASNPLRGTPKSSFIAGISPFSMGIPHKYGTPVLPSKYYYGQWFIRDIQIHWWLVSPSYPHIPSRKKSPAQHFLWLQGHEGF